MAEPGKVTQVSSGGGGQGGGQRQPAYRVLRERAQRLRRQAHQMEQLADEVEHLEGPAEEALWWMVTGLRL